MLQCMSERFCIAVALGMDAGPRRTKAPDRVVWGFGEGWLRGQDLNL